MNIRGVTNHVQIGFEAYTINIDPIPANVKGTKNLWIDREGLNTIILLNRYIIKTTSNDLLFYPLIRASLNPHQRSNKWQ